MATVIILGSRQEAARRNMIHTINWIGHGEVTAPEVVKFVGLKNSPSTEKFAGWGWHQFDKLKLAVKGILRQKGVNDTRLGLYDILSFALFIADDQTGGKTTWLIVPLDEGGGQHKDAKLCEDENPRDCPFHEPYMLYMPARWGTNVLDLVKMGIKKIVRAETPSGWKAELWDGTTVDYKGKNQTHSQPSRKVPSADYTDWLLDLLLTQGYINAVERDSVKAESSMNGNDAIALLLSKQILTPKDIASAKGVHFGCEYLDLTHCVIDRDVIAAVPGILARKYCFVPINKIGNTIVIAISDPSDLDKIDSLGHLLQMEVDLRIATKEDITAALAKYYPIEPPKQPGDTDADAPVTK